MPYFLSSFHLMGFPRLGVVGLFMEQWRSRERLERGTLSGPITRIWEGKCHMPQFSKQFNVIKKHYVIFYAKL